MPGHVEMWTVYDHPTDYPDVFIARRTMIYSGGTTVMTGDTVTTVTLTDIRREMKSRGLARIPRWEDDDPKIVEVWI